MQVQMILDLVLTHKALMVIYYNQAKITTLVLKMYFIIIHSASNFFSM